MNPCIHRPLVLATLALALSACRDVTRICTDEARPGLTLRVKDAATNDWAASGATLIAVDERGAMDSTSMPAGRPELDSLPLFGAYEHPGTFRITVRKPGYRDWVQTGVLVTADECHVRLTQLLALLQRS